MNNRGSDSPDPPSTPKLDVQLVTPLVLAPPNRTETAAAMHVNSTGGAALDASAHTGKEKDVPLAAPSPISLASTASGKQANVDAAHKLLATNSTATSRMLIAMAVVIPAAVFTISRAAYLYNWKGGRVIEWLANHPEIPVGLAVVYLLFVFATPKILTARWTTFFVNSEALKCILSTWNLFFSVFSFLGFCYSLPALINMVAGNPVQGLAMKKNRVTGLMEPAPKAMKGSLKNSLCYWNANVFEDGMSAFWLLAFDLSKIIEMMDTVFLILKGKRILFLHWYHHLTVMLFCWHAHVTYISNGLWFAVMNMGIHSMMYFYYFCFSCGLAKLVKPFASFITCLQILQMVAGLILQLCTLYYYVSLRQENAWKGNGVSCDTNITSLMAGLVMYGSYFVLFLAFFTRVYIHKDASASGSGSNRRCRAAGKNGMRSSDNNSSPATNLSDSCAASHNSNTSSKKAEADNPRSVVIQAE